MNVVSVARARAQIIKASPVSGHVVEGENSSVMEWLPIGLYLD